MITEGPYKGITSKDVRHMLGRMHEAMEAGEAKLAKLEKELRAIKGDDQRRPIYADAIKQMRTLGRGFQTKIQGYEKELRQIERQERRAI